MIGKDKIMNKNQETAIKTAEFTVSDAAWVKIKSILEQSLPNSSDPQTNKQRFRVEVIGGGCSGFQYKFDVDSNFDHEDDFLIKNIGVEVVIDLTSLAILRNSVLDHISNLGGEYFEIKNPNAKAKCGCGNSFAV